MAINFSSLVWLLFIIMLMQPLIVGRWYAVRRAQAIRAIERSHASRVITMIHRQERRSLFGFAMPRQIDLEDAQTIISAIKETPALTASEAAALGLPVKVGMPLEVMKLMTLYPHQFSNRGSSTCPSTFRVSGASDGSLAGQSRRYRINLDRTPPLASGGDANQPPSLTPDTDVYQPAGERSTKGSSGNDQLALPVQGI